MAGAFQILKQLKEASDYVANAPQASTAAPKAHGTAAPGVSRSYAREDHVHPKQTTVSTASKLAAKRNIALTGAVTGSADFDGSAGISIAATLTGFDASKITSGTIDIERIPAAALERLVVVADVAALLKLKSTDVQTGDTVQITAASSIDGVSYPAKAMFRVTDGAVFTGSQTEQTVSGALVVYTAGAAASVPWSGVTGKPSTFAPSAHDHSADSITSGTLAAVRGGTGRTDGKAVALATAVRSRLPGTSQDPRRSTVRRMSASRRSGRTRPCNYRQQVRGHPSSPPTRTMPCRRTSSVPGTWKVYLDGVLCTGGDNADTCTYVELGPSGSASTLIRFYQDIPATMDVLVTV